MRLQPSPLFALPVIFVVVAMFVHISRSLRKVLREEREDLLPAIRRLLRAERGPVVVEEPVARPVVAGEIVRLPILLLLGPMLIDPRPGRGLIFASHTRARPSAQGPD